MNEVVAALGLTVVLLIAVPVLRLVVPFRLADALAGQPGSVRWFVSFAVSEIGGYWGHRLSHEIPMLWRFHRVHHSAPSAGLAGAEPTSSDRRDHRPLVDGVAGPGARLLRPDGGDALRVEADTRADRSRQHEPPLRSARAGRGTPFFHHWHHSAAPGTWNTNYSNSLPVVDWIFGTMQLPGRWPEEYGCDGDVPDVGYVARFMSAWTRPEAAPQLEEACSPMPSGDGWEGVEHA